jgi:dolichyl-phosphate-mannose-protein mannosyltransferase
MESTAPEPPSSIGATDGSSPAAGNAPVGGSVTTGQPRDTDGFGRRLARRVRESLLDPEQVLALVLLAAFVGRAAWLDMPRNTLIFDESYYVNAARIILGSPVANGDHYSGEPAGLDPNDEHPPLGKVLIAASMAIFGDNGIGWRLPSVIAAMIALAALYRIVRSAGESAWLGILAVALFAFDNLAFVHGRIATLDMMVLAPLLAGAWAGLRERWLAAGALTGLAMLVKLTALFGLLSLLILVGLTIAGKLWHERRLAAADLRPLVAVGAGFAIVTVAGLWLLDLRFTTFTNPIEHLRHMLEYGTNLTRHGDLSSGCPGADSAPWQWLINDCEITYLRVGSTVRAGSEIVAQHASVDVRGAMNPVLLGGLVLAVPFSIWAAVRERSRLATWALAWAGASFLPYIPLALLGHRITYIYYFLPVVPAVAAAIALLLLRGGLPRLVVWGFVAAYLAGWIAYFPFRQIP